MKRTTKNAKISLTEKEKSGTIFKRIIITDIRSHRFKKVM